LTMMDAAALVGLCGKIAQYFRCGSLYPYSFAALEHIR
jgi:hypothetical protein